MESKPPALGNPTVLAAVRAQLDGAGVTYKVVEHMPTRTSEDSAKARGEELSVGAKALLLKVDESFALFVLPADKKLDSNAIRRELAAKNSRFASLEELFQRTGLVPGCVPPFGEPTLPYPLYADLTVGTSHGRVAFNAGMLTTSIIMSSDDWRAVAKPREFSFTL